MFWLRMLTLSAGNAKDTLALENRPSGRSVGVQPVPAGAKRLRSALEALPDAQNAAPRCPGSRSGQYEAVRAAVTTAPSPELPDRTRIES